MDDPPHPNPTNEDVHIYIIPVVGRKQGEVFPNFKSEDDEYRRRKRYAGEDDPLPKQGAFSITTWNVADDVKDYHHFFSNLCLSVCPEETKALFAHHLSLWEQLADTKKNGEDNTNKFAVIIEDDNTMEDHTVLGKFITGMKEKKIDILQLREMFFNSNVRSILTKEPTTYSYEGGYDINLSAYIIRLSALEKMHREIVDGGGISGGMYLDLVRVENSTETKRHILNQADNYIKHDPKLRAVRRVQDMDFGIWRRLGGWLSVRYPKTVFYLTTPLFSFFGLFDVNIMGLLIVLLIIILLAFDVRSRLIWAITGALTTSIIH